MSNNTALKSQMKILLPYVYQKTYDTWLVRVHWMILRSLIISMIQKRIMYNIETQTSAMPWPTLQRKLCPQPLGIISKMPV